MLINSINAYESPIKPAGKSNLKPKNISAVSFKSQESVHAPKGTFLSKFRKLILGGLLCFAPACSSDPDSAPKTAEDKLLAILKAAGIKTDKLPGDISYETTVGDTKYRVNEVRVDSDPDNVRYDATPTKESTDVPSRDYIRSFASGANDDGVTMGSNLENVEIEACDGSICSTNPRTGEVEIITKDPEQKGVLHVVTPDGVKKPDIKGLRFDGGDLVFRDIRFRTEFKGKIIEGVLQGASDLLRRA